MDGPTDRDLIKQTDRQMDKRVTREICPGGSSEVLRYAPPILLRGLDEFITHRNKEKKKKRNT